MPPLGSLLFRALQGNFCNLSPTAASSSFCACACGSMDYNRGIKASVEGLGNTEQLCNYFTAHTIHSTVYTHLTTDAEGTRALNRHTSHSCNTPLTHGGQEGTGGTGSMGGTGGIGGH